MVVSPRSYAVRTRRDAPTVHSQNPVTPLCTCADLSVHLHTVSALDNPFYFKSEVVSAPLARITGSLLYTVMECEFLQKSYGTVYAVMQRLMYCDIFSSIVNISCI